MKKFTLTAFIILFSLIAKANLINVPADFPAIQQAINAAVDGDTIVVQPGTYYENLNFHGKKVMLTSMFYLSNDTTYTGNTIINGSLPAQPDTGSCVLMVSGEDSTTILQGFTITAGTGTKWLDEHGAGTYREGGGILIQYSSPVIRNNIIVYNYATSTVGVSGSGGGGLRIGDSNPQILNNVISYNQARYGPGIVLNYTGAVIKNNLIAYNTGGQSYNGGGAVWANSNPLTATPKIIENNTIYGNHASTGTGGILSSSTSLTIINNILWNNTSPSNSQILKVGGGVLAVTYSDIQGGYTGSGNINFDPLFVDTLSFYLMSLSPCIDTGNSSAIYNDKENSSLPGFALFPSLGTIRNDMGAYGGQGAAVYGQPQVTGIGELFNMNSELRVFPNPASKEFQVSGSTFNIEKIELINVMGEKVFEKTISGGDGKNLINVDVRNVKRGIYFVRVFTKNTFATFKVVVE